MNATIGPRPFPVPDMSPREQAIYISKCFFGCTLCILFHFFLECLLKEEKSEKDLWYDALEYQDDDLSEKKAWSNSLEFHDARERQVHDIYTTDGKLAWISVPIKHCERLYLPELENERIGEEGEMRDYDVIIKLVEEVERTEYDASSSFLSVWYL
jgi:hypothetical protein